MSAEIARVEGRDLEAMRLYETAIRAAQESGSARHEAIANELAAGFYLQHAVARAGRACLEQARDSYLRWGALTKAKHLDAKIEELRARAPRPGSEPSLLDRLDLSSVVKATTAISTGLAPENLFETLMRILVEHAGADRGLLLVERAGAWHVRAEATAADSAVEVRVLDRAATGADLPLSALQYTTQVRRPLLLDDARLAADHPADLRQLRSRPRSLLCVPLVKQEMLAGVVYLENTMAADAFPPERIALLEVLGSQAAVALENARLYAELEEENRERRKAEEELRESECRWRNLFATAAVSLWQLDFSDVEQRLDQLRSQGVHDFGSYFAGHPEFAREAVGLVKIIDVNEATLELLGARSKQELKPDAILLPETMAAYGEQIVALAERRTPFNAETALRSLTGERIDVLLSMSVPPQPAKLDDVLVAFVDLRERKATEEALLRAREELARVTRVSTVGELAASIAHEINQPLAAMASYAGAALLWLQRAPPDVERARDTVERTIREGEHAAEIVSRVRALVKKAPPRTEPVEINELILEVLDLTGNEVKRNRISLRTRLSADDPVVRGDRIQLQQVLLNLILNAVEAMSEPGISSSELSISSRMEGANEVLVEVRDSGRGLQTGTVERIFDPFFTTRPDGMGMGLSISRSIVIAHGGRLWATPNEPRGAVFQFALPAVEPDPYPKG